MSGEMKTEIGRVTARSTAERHAAALRTITAIVTDPADPGQLQEARGVLEMLGLAEPRPTGRWVYHRKHGRHVWEEA